MKLEFNRDQLIKAKGNLPVNHATIKKTTMNRSKTLDTLLIEITTNHIKERSTHANAQAH